MKTSKNANVVFLRLFWLDKFDYIGRLIIVFHNFMKSDISAHILNVEEP